MADNFDLKKYITEAKLNIKVPVKEMARTAKEKYKLNSDFPQLKDRIKNPSNFKTDKKQQIINYFVLQGKEQGIDPMEVESLKSEIEKHVAKVTGTKEYSMTPDVKTQLLKSTTIKTATASSEEEPSDDDVLVMPSDAEDFIIGKSKLKTKRGKPEDAEEEGPSEKDIAKIKAPKITGTGMRAGEWLLDNGDLIDKIIKQYSQSTIRTGKIKEAEEGGLSSADFKATQTRSKEAAKAALPDLIQKLVNSLEELKDEDYNAYIKVLNDLDKYKFGATNTKGAMKMILNALGEKTLPAIGSKRKSSDEDELKKLGIDDEPINVDGEEEL
jgi:hypothetical protein